MRDEQAWEAEESLWTGADSMESLLDPACLMVFPDPAGIMNAAAAIDGLKGAPRWRTAAMTHRHLARPTADLLILAYRVRGERDGAPTYQAACSSTWHRGEPWLLVQHQQTPG